MRESRQESCPGEFLGPRHCARLQLDGGSRRCFSLTPTTSFRLPCCTQDFILFF